MKRRIGKFNFEPGIQATAIHYLREKILESDQMIQQSNKFILSFDEMGIKYCVQYDNRNDKVYGPHKHFLVYMARALFSKLKEAVYVNFDQKPHLEQSGDDGVHSVFQISEIMVIHPTVKSIEGIGRKSPIDIVVFLSKEI